MSEHYLTIDHLHLKDIKRIFNKIKPNPSTGCWEWQAALSPDGYAQLRFRGEIHHAHRILYAWLVEPTPRHTRFVAIDHLCRNPKCCNPLHLELVSARENALRGIGPTAVNAKKTHCKRGHELTPANVRVEKYGSRRCMICERARLAGPKHQAAVQKWREENREHIRTYNAARPGKRPK